MKTIYPGWFASPPLLARPKTSLRHACVVAVLAVGAVGAGARAADLFELRDVRLEASAFLDAQTTDTNYLLALDADRLAAPFLREAGLTPRQPSYGNWESSGLDGHMGGHYLSALSMMVASTGDAELRRRLDYFVAELKRAQDAQGNGYLGGIPGGVAAWRDVAAGNLKADNFSINGKWVPWYNLHKTFAGLRDAYRYAGNVEARAMLIKMSDWALALTARMTDEQVQSMLQSEHGGMNEVLADVAQMTGDKRYMALALRFSHQAVLQPLEQHEDKLTGLHANTQIPKVIGFRRIGDLTGRKDLQDAAAFFWQTVVEHRTVAIGGNSVKEHFHDSANFAPMIEEVEGPETCNTYNMLKLTAMLFEGTDKAGYADYYERALYNHILASQRPETGGFVYFTPMRPNHYRVYSQPDQAMWCCVGSGIESHAKYGEFIYAHEGSGDGAALFVNLFIPSTLRWHQKGVRIVQANRFPDEATTRIKVEAGERDAARFALKIRYPSWVAAGKLQVRLNGRLVAVKGTPGTYMSIDRTWRKGDHVDVTLPMTTRLEQMPDKSNWYAVMHGPIVLAAKTDPFPGERLNFLADDSRMGHVPHGQVCPLEAAPTFVADSKAFIQRLKQVAGKPLTFRTAGLVKGQGVSAATEFIPFFRLHDARYTMYLPQSTPGDYAAMRLAAAAAEADRLALDAHTVDQVAPGEQQPESDHAYQAEGGEAGVQGERHWRRATSWFRYVLNDPQQASKRLRLTLPQADADNRFDVVVNGQRLGPPLEVMRGGEFVIREYALTASLVQASGGKLEVRFVALADSVAGRLSDVRLLR